MEGALISNYVNAIKERFHRDFIANNDAVSFDPVNKFSSGTGKWHVVHSPTCTCTQRQKLLFGTICSTALMCL